MSGKAKLEETSFSSLEAMMTGYAEEATRIAWAEHHQRLDFSDGSVDLLEQILDGQSADDIEFQTRLWGSYFGELLRRRYGGEWELGQYPGEGTSLVPTLVIRGSRLYPLIKVYRRLTMGPAENLSTFYKMVTERLEKTPMVQ
jgi:hypothetical protein